VAASSLEAMLTLGDRYEASTLYSEPGGSAIQGKSVMVWTQYH
jgi:hypothetical protein